ncbi:MAG TPA: ATP-binding protein [Bryobacteraceae bacterium]|nr:ATP-binding protein [Bryobacteraceae bacterium]
MLALWLTALSSSYAIPPNESLASLSLTRWGASHGLPEETFANVFAPGDGYVWLASNHGLVRFDGRRAQVFRIGDLFRAKGTGSCSSSSLNTLLMGQDGNLWVGASSGCIFRIERDRFGGFGSFRITGINTPSQDRETTGILTMRTLPGSQRIEIGRRSMITTLDVSRIPPAFGQSDNLQALPSPELLQQPAPTGLQIGVNSRDSEGHVWAILSDNGLYELTTAGWKSHGLWDNGHGATPLKILAAGDGALWIASSYGLFRWQNGASRLWEAPALPRQPVFVLHEDERGCLWLGLAQGLGRICGGRTEAMAVGVEQEEIFSAVSEDPQGNLWFGGRWGNLYRLSSAAFRSYTKEQGLPESHFTGVAADRDGSLWASLKASGIAHIVNGNLAGVLKKPGILESQVILAHPEGGLVAASQSGLFRVTPDAAVKFHISPPIEYRNLSTLFWEAPGVLLYSHGAANFRLTRLPGRGERWSSQILEGPNRVRQWLRDAKGRIWALAQYGGLHYLDGDRYTRAAQASPERARAWYALAFDGDGLLWIGTTDGLEIYSPAEGRFLTRKPLLFGDQFFHMSQDRFGNIWCATRQGIVRFNRNQALELARAATDDPAPPLLFERFGEAQGLPTTNYGLATSATGAVTPDGRIWFPGLLGLVSVQPAEFTKVPRPPTPVLRQFAADGRILDINQPFDLPPGVKTLEIEFQTLPLDPLGGDFCRIRLNGLESAWRTCNEQRAVQYTNLSPGNYEFVIQTASQAGDWNGMPLRVPVTIEPAQHQKAWVRILTGASLLALIGLVLWNRQKKLLRRNRWLEERVEERTATLARATEAAEAANRAKSEFLATMSHEIRTPMNGVLGAVQILDESPLNQDQKKLVSVIRQSGENLVSIVDDILSLAKVEAGKLSLERTPVDIRALGENLVALFRPKAAAKGVEITFAAGADLPSFILTDPQRLRQVLLNLLGNAVKFTEKGAVSLQISINLDAKTMHFAVSDTGLGVPADKIPTLFDPFVQADSSTTRRFGGSGLGLSIVRRFVTAMGGTVDLESEPGRGSTFRVHLPFEAAPGTETPAEAPPPVPHASNGMTVLLAEDNLVNQMIFQKMLIRLGCQVIVANHGQEALDALRNADVDLVLMDCQMPVLDGYQTTREIRAWGGVYSQLPVIALTASAMAEDRQHCLEAGMNDFLSKPLMLSTLEATLAQWNQRDSGHSTEVRP